MTNQTDVAGWVGDTVVDQNGDKIGKVEEIYVDDASGQPEWLAIKTGLFGSKLSFAPLAGAERTGDDLRIPFSKDQVKDAPNVDADGHLEPEEEERLYRHYGRSPSETAGQAPRTETERSGGRKGGTDDAMTRSEEEVVVDKQKQETGKARLRKYVVTEQVQMTVPVQREEVRVEREPITDANRDAALGGKDISEDEHEVTLHEEEIDVQKRIVPKERVRMEKDVVTEDRQVSEEVRKEQIEVEGDKPRGKSR